MRNADTRVRATAELRRPRSGTVNPFLWDLDANLNVLQRRTIAHGGTDRKVERWTRNGLGHVLAFVDVEGHFTRHTSNLLGWNLTERYSCAA